MRTKTYSILVVDDNPADLYIIQEAFSECGFKCQLKMASSPNEARRLLSEEQFDLLLSDFGTDAEEGQSFIHSVRARSLSLPIIVLSGNYNSNLAYESGANAFVRKPNDRPSCISGLMWRNCPLQRLRTKNLPRLSQFRKISCDAPALFIFEAKQRATFRERRTASSSCRNRQLDRIQHNLKLILLVDDNAIIQLAAAEILKTAGYGIGTAFDGQEAVKACMMEQYDLVLMDCQMPKMGGREAAQQIRGLGKPPPVIIAVTAFSFKEAREHYMDDGVMNGYLQKPYSDEQLLQVVREKFAEFVQP